MHIAEGVLSPTVLMCGYAVAAAGIAIGIRKADYERLTLAAMLSAVFFVASLVHIPLGAGSIHLVLNGLLGVLLGWTAFPAICVSLLLQAVLFQYGGLAVLGVNIVNMATPAVLCHFLFKKWIRQGGIRQKTASFAVGFCSVMLASLLTAASLAFTDEGFLKAGAVLFVSNIPVMVVEGFIVSFIVSFIAKTKPELLEISAA